MSKIEDIYINGINKVIAVYVNAYKKDQDAGLKLIGREFSVARIVLIDVYNGFFTSKVIKPIEQLPEQEKQELWNRCKKFKDPKTVCKMLHVIKFI
jgi:exonuclease I